MSNNQIGDDPKELKRSLTVTLKVSSTKIVFAVINADIIKVNE